jgi:hypothetical protein
MGTIITKKEQGKQENDFYKAFIEIFTSGTCTFVLVDNRPNIPFLENKRLIVSNNLYNTS